MTASTNDNMNELCHISSAYPTGNSFSKEAVLREYADVFDGLGKLPGECHIVIDEQIRLVQHLPRRVAAAARELLKKKLEELELKGVIVKETEPTEWISSLVTVIKPGKMRICLDPKELNEAIKCPRYPLMTVEDLMPTLSKAKVFPKLDAKDGFSHIVLDEESS